MPPKVENILSNPFYDFPFPRKISRTSYFFNVMTASSVTFDAFIDQSQTLWRSLTLKTLIQQVALIVIICINCLGCILGNTGKKVLEFLSPEGTTSVKMISLRLRQIQLQSMNSSVETDANIADFFVFQCS